MPADDLSILIVIRGVERIVLVAAAAMMIYLGYRLFVLGATMEQRGEVEAAGWKVKLTSVGPGIFFALFGSVVLSLSVASSLSIEPDRRFVSQHDERPPNQITGGAPAVTINYFDNGEEGKSNAARLSRSIYGITKAFDVATVANLRDRSNLRTAERALEMFRLDLIAGHFEIEGDKLIELLKLAESDEDVSSHPEASLIEELREQWVGS